MKRLMLIPLIATVIGFGIFAATAAAAAPQNTALPTISGTAHSGSTLTASNGSWTNNPTSFAYQWQRCASDGSGCGDLTGATSKTYTLVAGDVTHTVRVVVTASNADGKASATSDASDIVASANPPTNTVRPAVSGSAIVGSELSVSNGSWSPSASSFTRQWQRCSASGSDCLNIDGATGQTYGVRSSDVGHTLRALVTAHTSSGQVATAITNTTAVVPATTTQTTTVTNTTTTTTSTTVTIPGHRPPTLAFQSLRRIGNTIFVRFTVCDSLAGKITITERDNKAGALPYARRFSVFVSHCGTFSRHWLLLARFRSPGRFLVTMRALDRTGALSTLHSRSIVFH